MIQHPWATSALMPSETQSPEGGGGGGGGGWSPGITASGTSYGSLAVVCARASSNYEVL